MRVIVGMSGGVDSSVAALLLKQAGHDVHGVTMKIWKGDNSFPEVRKHACYGPGEEEDIADAERIANMLSIPFSVFDLADEYEAFVLEYFRSEYLHGRTPNPCIRCNRDLKFSLLHQKAVAAGIQFDAFATGHYVRKMPHPETGIEVLRCAKEERKDQSYFLSLLRREQVAKSLFPLGELTKAEVRAIAKKHHLHTSDKAESQDFIEAEDYGQVFGSIATPGPIINEDGRQLGSHRGIVHYTVGQRKGLGIASPKPLHVLRIDACQNAIIVGEKDKLLSTGLTANAFNWVGIQPPTEARRCLAKIRLAAPRVPAAVQCVGDDRVEVRFDSAVASVTPGQLVAIYDNDLLLGGGTINSALTN